MGLLKRRMTTEEFTASQKARRQARAIDPNEARGAIAAGLAICAGRFERAGDPETAAVLAEAATKAEGLLATYSERHAIAEGVRVDHVGDAVTAAAGELRRKLPTCFPTDEDAQVFAEKLPLIEARAAARAGSDAAAKAGKAAAKALREFNELVESVACAATGDRQLDAAIRRLIDIGR